MPAGGGHEASGGLGLKRAQQQAECDPDQGAIQEKAVRIAVHDVLLSGCEWET